MTETQEARKAAERSYTRHQDHTSHQNSCNNLILEAVEKEQRYHIIDNHKQRKS